MVLMCIRVSVSVCGSVDFLDEICPHIQSMRYDGMNNDQEHKNRRLTNNIWRARFLHAMLMQHTQTEIRAEAKQLDNNERQ